MNVEALDLRAGQAVIQGILDGDLGRVLDDLDLAENVEESFVPFLIGALVVLLRRRFPPGYDVRDLTRFLMVEVPPLVGPDDGDDLPRVVERWLRGVLGEAQLTSSTDIIRSFVVLEPLLVALARDDQMQPQAMLDDVVAVMATMKIPGR